MALLTFLIDETDDVTASHVANKVIDHAQDVARSAGVHVCALLDHSPHRPRRRMTPEDIREITALRWRPDPVRGPRVEVWIRDVPGVADLVAEIHRLNRDLEATAEHDLRTRQGGA